MHRKLVNSFLPQMSELRYSNENSRESRHHDRSSPGAREAYAPAMGLPREISSQILPSQSVGADQDYQTARSGDLRPDHNPQHENVEGDAVRSSESGACDD